MMKLFETDRRFWFTSMASINVMLSNVTEGIKDEIRAI